MKAKPQHNTHIDDPLDLTYIESLRVNVLDPIIDYWFRAKLIGAETLPKKGPLIVASNHSGNAFPHDAMVLDALLYRHDGNAPEHKFRSVYSPKLARSWYMRLFGIDDFWRRCGAVDMTYYNFRALLQNDERIVYYPEGINGIGKGFNRRYQLQPFSRSFIQLSAETNSPVYPIYSVNAEFVNPTSFTIAWLDRFVDRYIGVPFLPIPAALIALIFPFFFYFGFPCKMRFIVGKPLQIRNYLLEAGCEIDEQPNREQADIVAERIRDIMQAELHKLVEKYGDKPYDFAELLRSIKSIPGKFWPVIGPGWPYGFIRHERDLVRAPAQNWFHFWLRDIDLISYYIPLLGWPLIALFRWLRKPPYGYRGLSKPEKKARQGGYLWSLIQRPIMPRSLRFGKKTDSKTTPDGDAQPTPPS